MDANKQPSTSTKPDLGNIVLDVLGDLAFMVTDDAQPELAVGTVWMAAEVTYFGETSGTLRCWCTRDFAARLAANLLGIEADEGEAQIGAEDAVREFMNVLCGQLVTTWHGTAGVFNLSIPTVHECIEAPTVEAGSADQSCQVSIEGEPLLITYQQQA